ncbi:hypothetical protein [Pilimelia columellifera]|uniref:DUF2795 domain-containing protein n=1 Tax=Pilimelia columellifera subsp. columellifera TaxID=706583 RepID=A0ABP6A6Y0_9ACTN
MTRESTKHGPRLDDEMTKETEGYVRGAPTGGRAQEWRHPEPPGEDQPDVTAFPEGPRPGGASGGLTAEELERRSQFGTYIRRSILPADAVALRADARDNEAPDWVLTELDRLPEGQPFATISDVWVALGHHAETRT